MFSRRSVIDRGACSIVGEDAWRFRDAVDEGACARRWGGADRGDRLARGRRADGVGERGGPRLLDARGHERRALRASDAHRGRARGSHGPLPRRRGQSPVSVRGDLSPSQPRARGRGSRRRRWAWGPWSSTEPVRRRRARACRRRCRGCSSPPSCTSISSRDRPPRGAGPCSVSSRSEGAPGARRSSRRALWAQRAPAAAYG